MLMETFSPTGRKRKPESWRERKHARKGGRKQKVVPEPWLMLAPLLPAQPSPMWDRVTSCSPPASSTKARAASANTLNNEGYK